METAIAHTIRYALFVKEYYVMLDLKSMIEQSWPGIHMIFSTDNIKSGFRKMCNADIDIIIADMILADGMIYEMLDELKWSKPAILFSEYQEMKTAASLHNNTYFLSKPVTQQELDRTFEIIRKQIMNEDACRNGVLPHSYL